MKRLLRYATACALLVAMLGVLSTRFANARPQISPVPAEPIAVSDVIDRINSYARLSPGNAELVLDSVDASNDPTLRLELALLLTYGPPPVRDRLRGLRVFEDLVRDNDAHLITQATIGLIEVLIVHLRENVSLKADLDRTMMRLQHEQQARKAAEEKLEALRKIEQELGKIKEQSSDGEGDGQNRNG